MKDLITIKKEDGIQVVSAKELYLGLGLNKTQWSRWYPTNIENNGYFEECVDWVGVRHDVEGNESKDFAISIDFAKHIAMMAKTKKSHEYRNYFIEMEQSLKTSQPQLSKEVQAIFMLDQRTTETNNRITALEDNLPLFNVECKNLQALVRKVGTKTLGGYKSLAYNNNSLRGKIYADIQHQLKREFGIDRYEAIKRIQLEKANEIVNNYKAPTILINEIQVMNNQIDMMEG